MVRRSQIARRVVVAVALNLAWSCGGGGGGGAPPTSFSFTAAGASVSEGGAAIDVQVVLNTTLPSLDAPASIDIADQGNGTATSGTDYTTFATQTLTFPIGSVDGDMQTVALTALTDQTIEGADETIRLRMQNPMGGYIHGSMLFTATVDDAEVATIQFAAPAEATPDETTASQVVTIELDLPAGATLGVAASARVADAGTGSATSGADYSAFASQVVTFTAGSADGATQTVALQVNDDASAELDETVELDLTAPTAGTVLGATSLYELTITDDDSSGLPSFVGSEGATGVENALAYDELINLGSQGVGDGPNAGTRVRVTNAGGSPMDLGAPRLTGTNLDDFVVEVEVAPLRPGGAESAIAETPAPDIAAPLFTVSGNSSGAGADGPGVAFHLDPVGMRELRALTRATMHGFPVPGFGDTTLDLRRLPLPITADAVLRVDGAEVPGGLASVLGDLTVWSGSIVEIPGSRVFLALSSEGSRGFLEMPFPGNRYVHLVTEKAPRSAGMPALSHLVSDADLPTARLAQMVDFCAEPRLPPGRTARLDLGPTDSFVTESLTTADCRIAIETDYQLYQRFNSVPAATTYVTQMMAAISDRYFTDVQTTFSIPYLGIYTTAADPWTSQDDGPDPDSNPDGSTADLLDEFQAAWAPSSWPISANLAHFVSGANLGGGIAYVDVLCDQSFGFGVSANISGNINWGTWTGQPGNLTWDFVVVAHELGHNFGASHTHSYCPPLDRCYSPCGGGGTLCSQGTLMSYCHLCGGMDNIDLEFGPMISNIMRGAVNSSCLGLSSLAGGDYVQYLVRFAPWGSTGARTATLQFTHDAPNATQPFRVQLTGTATP